MIPSLLPSTGFTLVYSDWQRWLQPINGHRNGPYYKVNVERVTTTAFTLCCRNKHLSRHLFFLLKCICVGGTLEKCNPTWVPQSAEASQPTGWPCVASRMSTKMTHQLLSIFNSLDASPSNVPIVLEEAARENGEKNRLRWYVITLNGSSLPHPFIVPTASEIMKWKASFFSIYHKSCKSRHSYLWCQRKPLMAWLLKPAKSQSINTSKHPMWVVNSIW